MASYEETFCQAMQLIAENAVKNAGYDKTIQATIVSCEDKTTGCYKVQYQDNIFLAYSADTKVKYTKGNLVYILIPNSNFDNNKTILGSVTKMGSDYIDVTDEKDQYEIIGNNICQQNKEFKLSTYETAVKVLYDAETSVDEFGLSEFDAGEYLSSATYLMLTASIKTNIAASQRYLGNYGLLVEAEFKDNTGTDTIVSKNYILDVNVMTGNPYKYIQTSPQYNFYIANGANFKRFTKISLFVKDFPEQKKSEEILPEDYDIIISNIGIYAAKKNEADSNGYSVSFSVPQGLYFNKKQTKDKHITAIVKAKNAALTAESANMSYYWFIQDNSIGLDSPDYCLYGGRGWKCLNQYNTLSNDPITREWLPASAEYVLSFDNAKLYDNQLKVVILYNDITLSNTISIKNYAAKHQVSINSDTIQFYFDNGSTKLTCNVTNAEGLVLTYHWVKYELDGSSTVIDAHTNSIQVNASDIVESAKYECTVYYEDELYGTAAITLYNSLTMEGSYHIEIENGTQVFKYNEDGVSPASSSLAQPQKLKDLKIILYDNLGNQIGDSIVSQCPIEWKVPTTNSMLNVANINSGITIEKNENYDLYKNNVSLKMGIASIYNYNNTNNNIEARLVYNGIRLTASTNFIFIKEGEIGSNGTNIICRIIPDTIDNNYSFPVCIYFKDQHIYPNFNSISGDIPKFKALLFENGEEITYDKVEWNFLTNNYGRTSAGVKIEDPTFYSVDSTGKVSCRLTSDEEPANILQAKVTYKNNIYYATLPLITIELKSNYDAILSNGFYYAEYNNSGNNAKYDSSTPFKFTVLDNNKDISLADDMTYTYGIVGSYYNNGNWIAQRHLTLSAAKLDKNKKLVKPSLTYQDETLNNAIWCIIKKNNVDIIHFHIPVHFYLNRHGFANLNDWNGNGIELNSDGGYILTPQVGAGKKDANNRFTGLLMGEVKESGATKSEVGLFGFINGLRSIFLDAETGTAEFGIASGGQIRIDPSTGEAVIESGDFQEKDATHTGSGMQINLSTPEIRFGSGKFHVDKNGILTAQDVNITGGVTIETDKINVGDNIYSGQHNTFGSTADGFFLGADGLSIGRKFSVDSHGTLKITADADIKGKIYAQEGSLGKGTQQIKIGTSNDNAYSYLYSNNHNTLDNTTPGFFLGPLGLSIGSKFNITLSEDGRTENVTIKDADLSGNFDIKSGTLGTGIRQLHVGSTADKSFLYGQAHNNLDSKEDGFYLGIDGLSIGKNFSVDAAGSLIADQVDISGNIDVNSGTLGSGFKKINIAGAADISNLYTQTHTKLTSIEDGIYLGTDGFSVGSKLNIDNKGILTANGANLTGNFIIESGTIGDITLDKTIGIYSNSHNTFTEITDGFFLGTNGLSIGKHLSIDKKGILTADNVNISGSIQSDSIQVGKNGHLTTSEIFDMILSGKVNIENAYYEANKGQTSTIQIIDSITIETNKETNQITGIKTHLKELKFTQGGLIGVKDIDGETTVNE